MPIAQVLESAAKVSPPPIAAATHLNLGTATLPKNAGQHDRAGHQADLALEVPALRPRLTAKPSASQAVIPPSSKCTCQPRVTQRLLQPERRADRSGRPGRRLRRDA